VEFASPDPAAASPPGSCPPGGGHRGRASPSTRAGNRYLQVRASSFPPAVPPASHKQRSRAVCSGQSRSLETTVALGSGSLTWGGEAETAWHARGQGLGSALLCPAGRSGPCRGGWERPRQLVADCIAHGSGSSKRLSAIYRSEGLVCFGVIAARRADAARQTCLARADQDLRSESDWSTEHLLRRQSIHMDAAA
jgi:hypothetical protein